MTFKVPFLSDAQLESAAQELLRRYAKWKGEPPRPPIPVDAIAESVLGLTLEMGDLRKKLGKPDVDLNKQPPKAPGQDLSAPSKPSAPNKPAAPSRPGR